MLVIESNDRIRIMNPRFCLVDEKWIPIAGHEPASLLDVFQDRSLLKLDGNPIQIIAVLKLLIAIAYASNHFRNHGDWISAGNEGMADSAIRYLLEKRDCFYLYGDRPFLQFPVIAGLSGAKESELHYDIVPDLASENDSILRQLQLSRNLSDAEKALFIVTLMNYALGGKRTMKTNPLSLGYERKSAKAAPSIGGFDGLLQTAFLGKNVCETVWLNLPTDEDIGFFPNIINPRPIPPWENLPLGEIDNRANEIKTSPYAWYVSLSRFPYLTENGIYYADGIPYPSVADGYVEPHITFKSEGKAVYVDPSKKPWRMLSAILQSAYTEKGFENLCPVVKLFFTRNRTAVEEFGIWSGGLKVSANSGDQSVKGTDDYVLSEVLFISSDAGERFFGFLNDSIISLDKIDRILRVSVSGYAKAMGADANQCKNSAAKASVLYWEYADTFEEQIVEACLERSKEKLDAIKKSMRMKADSIYNRVCPALTSRELMANAVNSPWRKNAESR